MPRPVLSESNRSAKPLLEALEARQLLANVTAGFTDSTYVSGLTRPTAMTFAPDGRLFVSEQDGKIRIVKNGTLLPTPALKLAVSKAGERGVQSTAFDPDFAHNGFIYLYYTATSPAHNRLSRFTVTGDTIDPASEKILIDLEPLNAVYHNSGALHFGEDGKLYISVGDNVRGAVAQSTDNLLGKILRINPDGTIPTDNPFYKTATGINRAIWDMGLRNPFTFAIEQGTGRLFINDVGDATWEEVDRDSGHGGNNFGWPNFEGPSNDPRFTTPLYYYGHNPGAAIVGGVFYPNSGGTFPSGYNGKYIFADHVDGLIQALDPDTGKIVGVISKSNITANADLDIGPDGALYYLERTFNATGGRVGRIQFNGTGAVAPSITQQPANVKVGEGSMATFDVGVTGTTPFTYQWQKNSKDIPGATDESYTIPAVITADSGNYRVIITNDKGSATSNVATLTVTVNQSPVVDFKLPDPNITYQTGDTISYAATATDPQDGDLSGTHFTWQVDFHHDTHLHPFISPTTGERGGTFIIPRIGETSSNTWYRLLLTVTDNDGNSTHIERDIFPKKSKVTLTTNVPGLSLNLDSIPNTAPIGFKGVEHFFRTLEAPLVQTLNGKTYYFQGWSDGGAAKHTISTPTADTVYTATYVAAGASGTGLIADYYNNEDFSGTHIQRVEPVVNFKYEDGSPDPKIANDTFSAKFSGLFKAAEDATYTFYVKVDDGARLWVGNQLLLNQWSITGKTNEYTGTITLKKGKNYAIRLDYREHTGAADIELRYSTANTPKAIVPQTALFPVPVVTPTGSGGGSNGIGGTISPSGDTYVRNGSFADSTFGTGATLQAKQATTSGLLRVSYLKFNLKNFSTIDSAKLRLFGALSDTTATNVAVDVFATDGTDLNEATTTFNNAPQITGNAIASALITNNTYKYYEFDVSSFIKAQKAAGHNVVTLAVKAPTFSSNFVAFNSREAGANRPYMVIG
jgi:glucose/arabinose dehydrogenase